MERNVLLNEKLHSEYVGRYEFANRKEWRNFYINYLEYSNLDAQNILNIHSNLKYLDIVAKFIDINDNYIYIEQIRTPNKDIIWAYIEQYPIPKDITDEQEVEFIFFSNDRNTINFLPLTTGELKYFPKPDKYYINGRYIDNKIILKIMGQKG